ncbi:aldo/keto reductase [Streptomyces acidicola]|uniref:aldo/keto reductase n=1 Tax=Streptomyces acidicola TaxID=2596892 RepID=UPI00380FBAD0
MKTRRLRDLEVSAIGMGVMGFSHGYGPTPLEDEAIELIRYAHELGCTFFDTAEGYGAGLNEELLGRAVAPFRQDVVVATKFRFAEAESLADVRRQLTAHLDASLQRLGTDYVDLYYQHRVSPDIPVEYVAEAMGELIEAGRMRGWGQSQATVEQIRRAHAVTPITAIQSEYSMMERGFEADVIPACAELGIGFVPFSPLASGFLSGKYSADRSYTGDDVRRVITRFEPGNVRANQPLLDLLHRVAEAKSATPAQVSLAWMLHKQPFHVPIPGMRTRDRIAENLGAAEIDVTDAEFADIETALDAVAIHGDRTDADIAKLRDLD